MPARSSRTSNSLKIATHAKNIQATASALQVSTTKVGFDLGAANLVLKEVRRCETHYASQYFMCASHEVIVFFNTLSSQGLPEYKSEEISLTPLLKGRKVIILTVPGAFTPGCSKSHLPSFINNYDALKAKGVDEVICTATNDAYVMHFWGVQQVRASDLQSSACAKQNI